LSEVTTTPDNAHNRNISYQYDSLGQMVRWSDSVTGLNLNTFFDAKGNCFTRSLGLHRRLKGQSNACRDAANAGSRGLTPWLR